MVSEISSTVAPHDMRRALGRVNTYFTPAFLAETAMAARRGLQTNGCSIRKARNKADAPFGNNPTGRGRFERARLSRATRGGWHNSVSRFAGRFQTRRVAGAK